MPYPLALIQVYPHRVTTLRHRVRLLRNGLPPAPLDLRLRYTAADPFAVRMTLLAHGVTAGWTLSREALVLGLRRHEGAGDVAVWPVRALPGPDRLSLRLGPLGNCAVFQAERAVVSAWLDVTLRLVPPGSESDHVVWDDFLAPLLDQG
ncbi:SsgA family sporulation/cell division regulator [Streptomyces sp. NPDC002564]|uniref:SsgA family sporulation/cell division regulator n=1 Tax=Streptomyces sp. NPDC002564 TaxID=3364649 RepID=UPI0036B826D2